MNNTLFDVSDAIDAAFKSLLCSVTNVATESDTSWFLTGAMARDLVLEFVYGIRAGRATRDVDLGVMVANWFRYKELKERLCATGDFSKDSKLAHRLYYQNAYQLDLIPFGAIEHHDGTIAWPPEYDVKMRVLGFADAWRHSLSLRIAANCEIRVLSLPGLMLLKLIAWEDRHLETPKKDASDIALLLRQYSDAGNLDRLYNDHSNILEADAFDLGLAGSRLLGRDLAKLLNPATEALILGILERETNPAQSEMLITELAVYLPDRNAITAASLLGKLKQGVEETKSN